MYIPVLQTQIFPRSGRPSKTSVWINHGAAQIDWENTFRLQFPHGSFKAPFAQCGGCARGGLFRCVSFVYMGFLWVCGWGLVVVVMLCKLQLGYEKELPFFMEYLKEDPPEARLPM